MLEAVVILSIIVLCFVLRTMYNLGYAQAQVDLEGGSWRNPPRGD